ncbi:MAG: SH3 domain-containing protein [Campylobacteraceae bacterium]|jgi:cell wall-associated NlpC family hydrolase|nr:SH3 domain-containing protein [Campylobacteraceae bacterium]
MILHCPNKILACFFVLCAALFLSGCGVKKPNLAAVLEYEQNVSLFLDAPLLAEDDLNIYKEVYFKKQFATWERKKLRNAFKEAAWGLGLVNGTLTFTGENRLDVSNETLQKIKEQANFAAYGSVLQYAITTHESHLRVLPTDKPLFVKKANDESGYPFDYAQNSLLGIMQPLLISHYSKDFAWAFVESAFAAGWVKTSEIALIDEQLTVKIKNADKIVITKDNAPLYFENGLFAHYIKMGATLPLLNSDGENYKAFIVISDASKNAKEAVVTVNKEYAAPFPLEFNEKNVKKAVNELLGENYGWGGLYNNRDCSAMTKDFFSLFGIWLSRNSRAQKNTAVYLDISNLTVAQKEEMLTEFGVPYLTLVYMPGHIMLYIGENDGRALIMHNIWALTNSKNKKFLIGKSIVSDLFIGKNLPDMEEKNLLIGKIQGFTVFAPKEAKGKIKLLKTYKESISSIKDNFVYFKNGKTLVFDDKNSKNYEEMLQNADIQDQFYEVYKKGALDKSPVNDAGRIRNGEFFKALYGADKEEVENNLVSVIWLPSSANISLHFNKNNGAAKALQSLSNELDKLGEEYLKFVKNPVGTYKYRNIADTNRLSMHAFGIAIDLDINYANYWLWDSKTAKKYKNSIPQKIVDIFEKHGFIWGGKWLHYDTMHFEYRPELF